jgi:[acyl-carrier-protein] S-malonyltransferase
MTLIGENAPSIPYAILMAGQLSERAGMAEHLREYPGFSSVADHFNGLTADRFERWVTDASQEEISETFTAPSVMVLYDILCGQVACRRWGPPAAVAGYSLGFYAAAVLARCTSAAVILQWLEKVNAYNRTTFGEGRFRLAAVTGLTVADMRARLADWGLETIRIANINNARQLVLAGLASEMEEVLQRLRGGVLDARDLPLDIPLHTPHLEGARQAVAAWWASVPAGSPIMTLLSPVDGEPVTSGESFKRHMMMSLVSPTHWQAVVARLKAMNIKRALDVSPAGELGRMARWTYRELEVIPVSALWEGR